MSIGKTFRHARKEQRLSMREVARRTGLSVAWVSEIERDNANPSIEALQAIASAMGRDLIIDLARKVNP